MRARPAGKSVTGSCSPPASITTSSRSAQVGHFKTPSLHHFYPDAEPFMHDGIFGRESNLFKFYERSLGFRLASGESTGLHYWLQNCPKGIGRPALATPPECN